MYKLSGKTKRHPSTIFYLILFNVKHSYISSRYIPKQLSCAHAAKEAASLGTIFLSLFISNLKSRRQVTKSIDGCERTVLSDNMSNGAAAGIIG